MRFSIAVATTIALINLIFIRASSDASEANLGTKSCIHDENSFRCVRYIKNYDADTITVEIANIHPLLGKKISVRVLGIDTPEVATKNKCEKEAGLRAKRMVANILKKAQRIDLTNIQRDKYFRILADVIVDGKSLSAILLSNKLAYAYDGGTKIKINWCNTSGF